jgi:hypothetical protein
MTNIINQITLASFLSLLMSSSTDPTITPPYLSVGLSTFSTFSLGSASIPKSFKRIVSIVFFFALMILCTLANLGVFSLRSQVNTAGKDTCIFCNPKSTSLVTSADFPSSDNYIRELNVAQGIPIIAPSIYPV